MTTFFSQLHFNDCIFYSSTALHQLITRGVLTGILSPVSLRSAQANLHKSLKKSLLLRFLAVNLKPSPVHDPYRATAVLSRHYTSHLWSSVNLSSFLLLQTNVQLTYLKST